MYKLKLFVQPAYSQHASFGNQSGVNQQPRLSQQLGPSQQPGFEEKLTHGSGVFGDSHHLDDQLLMSVQTGPNVRGASETAVAEAVAGHKRSHDNFTAGNCADTAVMYSILLFDTQLPCVNSSAL